MKTNIQNSTVAVRLGRLIAGFVLALAITGVLSFQTLARLKVNGPVYAGIVQQKDLLGDILPPPMYILETYMTALQVLGETDPAAQKADLEKLQSLKKDFVDRTEFWSRELADSPVRRVLVEDSHKPAAEFFSTLETEFVPAIQKQDRASATAIAYGKLKTEYLEHRKAIDQAVALATQNSQLQEAAAVGEVRHRTVILISALVGGLILIGIYSIATARALIRVVRSATDELAEGSNQVSSAAGQVSSSSQVLAEGASEQASSLEEASSSLEEMSSMTKRNAENAQKANAIAKQARDAADKGVNDMQTMSTAIAAIKISSDDIAKIIKTIDEIAFQTNILALNAAVEAARAGEAGMGFAVVADEVRNLAQRCAQAAKETENKIESAITKTGQGVEISAQVAAALNEIVAKVRQVDDLVSEVAGASREQTDGITQLNSAVSQMDKVTQSNAANAEETAAAAQQLNAQAAIMKRSVAQLTQLVGSTAQALDLHPALPVPPSRLGLASATPKLKPDGTRSNGSGHNYGHVTMSPQPAKRRDAIPMDSDFKNF